MTISVIHPFVSAQADGVDTTLVRPSNWNAEHTFTMATNKLLGRGTAATGAVEEITLGSGLALTGTTLAATAATPVITIPQGRLTLQAATPVMTATVSGATTIYYSAYQGILVPLYDGSTFVMTSIGSSEISVATTDTTKSPTAIGASKVNDWFVWNDAGTVRLGHGPDWTSDTARSAGTALTRVNGILLNNAAITNGPTASRGTYVGTTRSNASSTLDWIYGAVAANGTAGFFGVWNAYNRVEVASVTADSTDNWTYASTTIRAANASSAMRCSFVRGLDEESVIASYQCMLGNSSTVTGHVGVGLDATTAFSGTPSCSFYTASVSTSSNRGEYAGYSGIGFHFFSATEACNNAATVTFYGNNANPALFKNALTIKMRA